MRRLVIVVLALVLVVSVRTSAQDPPPAQKWTNVEWYEVWTWYFSDRDEALSLWTEHFLPVVMEVMPEVTCLWFETGETRVACHFPMSDGPAGMEWRNGPYQVEFNAAFAAREGEATTELYERLGNVTSRMTNHIALKHTGGM
jgi:hypothetical protein